MNLPLIPVECVTCFCLDDSRDDCLCVCHPANRCTECGRLRGPDCEAAEFYADTANREPVGPGRKRRTRPEVDDTDMTPAEFKAAMARGIPVEIVTSREEYERRRSDFYEDDEPISSVQAAFDRGEKRVTKRPGAVPV